MTDIVIYGATSAGVTAAIQAARMNKSVILIEPGRRIGGLTTGGLGQTDIGNKAAIGGISREFYRRIKKYYAVSTNWKWQKPDEYKSNGQSISSSTEDTMWTFEPSVALTVLQEMLAEAGVDVIFGERLNRKRGVKKDGARILYMTMESGKTFSGQVFIDATYEGDLMAAAGVGYHVGREAESVYGENLNGVRTIQAKYHQFRAGVDPYIVKGDKSSGLLPGIEPTGPDSEGAGDHRVQAYCFRMCMTDHPDNQIPVEKPDGYNERTYELLFRNYEVGEPDVPWINGSMPNRKTDLNNRLGFSTDFIGHNYCYPDASYAEREKIVLAHLKYQQGLLWTLANHPRIPIAIRDQVARWCPCKDEFVGTNGWQEQLYIREARRMIGTLVMTQSHCEGKTVEEDAIGLAAYTMDSHHVQRYVTSAGFVRNEGDVQVGGFVPYAISYRSIIPRESECSNLLVTSALSASHIAFGSIRMEPVFMVLGQSAATAAARAVEEKSSVQKIRYDRLRDIMLSDGQILQWKP